MAGLLLAAGADVEATAVGGKTVLIWAAENGFTDVAGLLLAAGADLRAKGNNGWTALMSARGAIHARRPGCCGRRWQRRRRQWIKESKFTTLCLSSQTRALAGRGQGCQGFQGRISSGCALAIAT